MHRWEPACDVVAALPRILDWQVGHVVIFFASSVLSEPNLSNGLNGHV